VHSISRPTHRGERRKINRLAQHCARARQRR
jgi:hypothetical protein